MARNGSSAGGAAFRAASLVSNLRRTIKPVSALLLVTELRQDHAVSRGGSKELARSTRAASVRRKSRLSQILQSNQPKEEREMISQVMEGIELSSDDDDDHAATRRRGGKRETNGMTKAELSYVVSLIVDLQWALVELGEASENSEGSAEDTGEMLVVPFKRIEDWALLIHEQLTHDSRRYHGISHMFSLAAGMAPLALLAAFFRDVFVVLPRPLDPQQLAHDIHVQFCSVLNRHFGESNGADEALTNSDHWNVLEPGSLTLRRDLDTHDVRLALLADVFDYQPGQDLTELASRQFSGFDIFLSAVIMTWMLGDVLSLAQLGQIYVCLQASIPFRTNPPVGAYVPVLYERFKLLNEKYQLLLTDQAVQDTIQRAFDFLNRVLGNMVTTDLPEFIEHTWALLPEHDVALRNKSALYTQTDMYQALHHMMISAGQIAGLAAQRNLYTSFRGYPTPDELQQFNDQVQSNLQLVLIYLQARYVAAAMTTSLAILTGGDVPYSFFHGDDPGSNIAAATSHPHCSPFTPLGRALTSRPPVSAASYHEAVYNVLCGSANASSPSSPTPCQGHQQSCFVSAFLYREFGTERIQAMATDCPTPDQIGQPAVALQFLQKFPPRTVDALVQELVPFCVTRAKLLQTVVSKLYTLSGEPRDGETS
jgi:hypothetical protein